MRREIPAGDTNDQMSRRTALQVIAAGVGTALGLPLLLSGSQKHNPNGPPDPAVDAHVGMEVQNISPEMNLAETGEWHQDGVEMAPGNGLRVTKTDRRIYNKRAGGRYDPNPQLNVFGTRLQVEGDFAVGAEIESKGPFSFNLYGQPPLRLDDVRYERSRLECQIDGNRLRVAMWDGSNQKPRAVQECTFAGPAAERALEVRRVGHNLSVLVNGVPVCNLGNANIFQRGEVWFGLNNEDYEHPDRDLAPAWVRSLTATSLDGHTLQSVNTTTLKALERLPDGGLQGAATKSNMLIGTAAIPAEIVSDPRLAELLLGGEVGIVTPENSLKPQELHPSEDTFTFDEADAAVDLLINSGVQIHGHALVYDKAMPEWMRNLKFETEAEREHVREVLVKHVRAVVSHFKGRIKRWDVVNEPIDGSGKGAKLVENIWRKALGDEYIAIALRAAREADPDAELWLNDYGMETDPEGRGQVMMRLVSGLNESERLVDGVGFECHVYNYYHDRVVSSKIIGLMNQLNNLVRRDGQLSPVKARVSEMDVSPPNEPDGLIKQAAQYERVARLCMEVPNCHDFAVWGLYDGAGSETGIGEDGKLHFANALLYAVGYIPKLARRRIMQILNQ